MEFLKLSSYWIGMKRFQPNELPRFDNDLAETCSASICADTQELFEFDRFTVRIIVFFYGNELQSTDIHLQEGVP